MAERRRHADHHGVVAPDARVVLGLIFLERDEQIVRVLAGELRVARVERLVEVLAVAGDAAALLQQRGDLRRRLLILFIKDKKKK